MHFSDNWFLIEFVTAVNCTMARCTCCHSLKIQTASSFTNSTVEAQEAEEASITSQGSGVGPPMPTEKSSPRLSASSQVITVVLLKAWTLAGDAFSPFFLHFLRGMIQKKKYRLISSALLSPLFFGISNLIFLIPFHLLTVLICIEKQIGVTSDSDNLNLV